MNYERELAASPPMGATCLSDLVLDELVAARPMLPNQQQHLDGCPRCAARRELLMEASQLAGRTVSRLLAAARVRMQAQAQAPHPRQRWWARAFAFGGLAIATAVLLLVVLTRSPGSGTDEQSPRSTIGHEGIRIKGVSMRCFVQRAGKVTLAASGAAFEPGDALRCAIMTGETKHVLLVGIDRDGEHVAAYYPFAGSHSLVIPAGIETPLPNSLVLDDAPGPEYLVALFATNPFTVEQVKHQLAQARREGLEAAQAISRLLPEGNQLVFVVRKP